MALETATYIDGLVATNPAASDAISTADDHLRLIKSTIKSTFPNINGAVTVTPAQINDVVNKATLASPAFTGTPTAPTATAGTNTTQVATTAFVGTAVTNATGSLGSMSSQSSSAVSITGGSITGITDLAVADGGTGASSITANSVVLGNGTGALSGNLVAPGTSGNVLTSNGTTWTSAVQSAPAALSTASGSAPSYSARAWVNFNGTGTVAIRSSGNVSSITDGGTGVYTVNFTTAMPDADYSVNGTVNRITGSNWSRMILPDDQASSWTNSSIKVTTWGGISTITAVDYAYVSVGIFR